MKLMFVVASRPNFMKIAPLIKEAKKRKINFSILYTEQHKSESMTGIFSRELNIPKPDYSLGLKAKVGKLSKNRKLMAFFSSIAGLCYCCWRCYLFSLCCTNSKKDWFKRCTCRIWT